MKNKAWVLSVLLAFFLLFAGCTKSEKSSTADYTFEAAGEYATYTDYGYNFQVTVPTSYPFIYQFSGRSIFTVLSTEEQSDPEKDYPVIRTLTVYFQHEGEDFKRNSISIRGQVGSASGWLSEFSGTASDITTDYGAEGIIKRKEDDDGVELLLCFENGFQSIYVDFSKAAYAEAESAIMDIIRSLKDLRSVK